MLIRGDIVKLLVFALNLIISSQVFALEAPKGFTKELVTIDDVTFNIYKGGQGEALLLLHGYSQSSLMWSKAMMHFQAKYRVIVPDLRGSGNSDAPPLGYDKLTMAEDIKKLLDHYGITKVKIVGHDIGLMVAYTFAATYPDMVERLALMDSFLPGVGPGDVVYNDPSIWQFRFNGPVPDGQERIFFDSLWNGFSARPGSFPEDAKKQYVSEYARPGRMKAGFAYFSTFPQDALHNKKLAQNKLKMPVLAIGGEKSNGYGVALTVKLVAESVQMIIVKNCGHWMMEECPNETLQGLENFFGRQRKIKVALSD